MPEDDVGRVAARARRPRHVVVAMVLATVVVVVVPLVWAAWSDRPSLHLVAPHDVFRPSAGDGPYVAELVVHPEDRVVVQHVTFDVVGDGTAQPVVCEWADGAPPPFGLEPEDAHAVTSACGQVRPLVAGEEVGREVRRSLMLRFEATGPDDPTLCSMTATLRAAGSGREVTLSDAPVGVAIRDGGLDEPFLDPFAGCPNPPEP